MGPPCISHIGKLNRNNPSKTNLVLGGDRQAGVPYDLEQKHKSVFPLPKTAHIRAKFMRPSHPVGPSTSAMSQVLLL